MKEALQFEASHDDALTAIIVRLLECIAGLLELWIAAIEEREGSE